MARIQSQSFPNREYQASTFCHSYPCHYRFVPMSRLRSNQLLPRPRLPSNVVKNSVLARDTRVIDVVLLKKMGDFRRAALRIDVAHPIEVHQTTRAFSGTLAASDHPIDAVQVWAKVNSLKKW